jgi:succinate dehydrogenase / fumarate reductase, cytochrome b subunit
MSSSKKQAPQRPLSPHLTVYRPQISSVMSILHRITGVGLSVGLLGLVAFVVAVARGQESYYLFIDILNSTLGLLVAFGVSVALFYHLFNGIRHLGWDAGHGFDIKSMTRTGYLVLLATVISTALFWLAIFSGGLPA